MVACFLAVGLLFAQAEDPDQAVDAAMQANLRRLVRQLDSSTVKDREEAEQALIKLGPSILDSLPEITARTPAEVKQRLDRVRKTLELQVAKTATETSLITLKGKMSIPAAFAEIAKQSGNTVVGAEGREGEVDLAFEKTPFWEALDKTLDQAGMTTNPYGGRGDAIVLMARPDESRDLAGSADYEGIFRVEPIRIEAVRDLRNPEIDGMRITVKIDWEPRTTPISISQPLKNVSAKDEAGGAIVIDAEYGELEASVQPEIPSVELMLPIGLPDRGVKQIAALTGELTAMIPGRQEKFEFTGVDTLKDAKKSKGAATVLFDQLRKNGEVYEVRMRLRFDKAENALESHRQWVFNNKAIMLDAKGEVIEDIGFEGSAIGVNEVALVYRYDLVDGPAGHTFVYETPASIVKQAVPYELKNIPLP